jgi:hypothetical protein
MTISRFGPLKPTSRLQAVFYVLMTDHLPAGTFTEIVKNITEMPFGDLEMEDALIGQKALDLAEAVTK